MPSSGVDVPRFLLWHSSGALFAATLASTAQAVPPTRTTEPPVDFDSNSLFCGFSAAIGDIAEQREDHNIQQRPPASRPPGAARIASPICSTGKSMVLTNAGNLITNPEQTTDTFTGRLALFLFPGEPFGPGASLFVGRVVLPTSPCRGASFTRALTSPGSVSTFAPRFAGERATSAPGDTSRAMSEENVESGANTARASSLPSRRWTNPHKPRSPRWPGSGPGDQTGCLQRCGRGSEEALSRGRSDSAIRWQECFSAGETASTTTSCSMPVKVW